MMAAEIQSHHTSIWPCSIWTPQSTKKDVQVIHAVSNMQYWSIPFSIALSSVYIVAQLCLNVLNSTFCWIFWTRYSLTKINKQSIWRTFWAWADNNPFFVNIDISLRNIYSRNRNAIERNVYKVILISKHDQVKRVKFWFSRE